VNREDNIRITSAEMENLWTSYQNDTMAICFIKHCLAHMKDDENSGRVRICPTVI
jgi:hypothetical protein